jgi:hypothetical protein
LCDANHTFPRYVRCPYDEGKPFLFLCQECKQGIYDGDIFYNIDGKFFHKNCIEDNYTPVDILKLVGIKEKTA